MCRFNAAPVIAKGSLVYNVTFFLSISMTFLHFACNCAIAYGTVEVQTTAPPTPIAWLFAKRNAQIAFRTTEDAKYGSMTVAQPELLFGEAMASSASL